MISIYNNFLHNPPFPEFKTKIGEVWEK